MTWLLFICNSSTVSASPKTVLSFLHHPTPYHRWPSPPRPNFYRPFLAWTQLGCGSQSQRIRSQFSWTRGNSRIIVQQETKRPLSPNLTEHWRPKQGLLCETIWTAPRSWNLSPQITWTTHTHLQTIKAHLKNGTYLPKGTIIESFVHTNPEEKVCVWSRGKGHRNASEKCMTCGSLEKISLHTRNGQKKQQQFVTTVSSLGRCSLILTDLPTCLLGLNTSQ